MKKYISIIILLTILSSCKKDPIPEYKLSEEQKELNPYKVGDSSIFKEVSSGDLMIMKITHTENKIEEVKTQKKRIYTHIFPRDEQTRVSKNRI